MSSSRCSFHIISSLRYDPDLPKAIARNIATEAKIYPEPRDSPYYLLAYHHDRLLSAAKHFNWDKACDVLHAFEDLAKFSCWIDGYIPDKTKPWRLRILLDQDGIGSVEVSPTEPRPLSNLLPPSRLSAPQPDIWCVSVDTQATEPSSFTTHKTTARDMYALARTRAGISSPLELKEVLVVNPAGEVMEGSITTPYFRRRLGASTITDDHNDRDYGWVTPPLSSGGNAGATRRYALAQGFCVEQVVRATDLIDGEECWLSNGVRGFMRGTIRLSGKVSDAA